MMKETLGLEIPTCELLSFKSEHLAWLLEPQWRKVFTTCSIRRRQRGQLVKCEEHVIQQHI